MEIDINKVFSEAFSRISQHFGLLVGIGMLLYVLPSIFVYIIKQIATVMILNVSQDIGFKEILAGGAIFILVYFIIIIIVTLIQLLFTVTMIKLYSEKRNGKELAFGEAIKNGFPYLAGAFGLSIVQGILLGISLSAIIAIIFIYTLNPFSLYILILLVILFIVPLIVFGIYWMFSVYALVIDNKDIFDSITQSKNIVKGNWWSIFLIMFLIFISSFFIFFIFGIFSIPLLLIPIIGPFISELIKLILSLFLTIILTALMESIYMDLKEKKGL